MGPTDWYFDFVSPFAYLQLELLQRNHADFPFKPIPVVLGAILSHWRTIGPAEVPAKRRFTYRMALWQARRLGIPMRFPPAHPFNSLAALRLAIVAGATVGAVTSIHRHIWRDGGGGDSPDALASLATTLGIDDIASTIADPAVKSALRDNTEQAIARGVFGVPTLMLGEELFWGLDATDLALAVDRDPALLSRDALGQADELRVGVQRSRG